MQLVTILHRLAAHAAQMNEVLSAKPAQGALLSDSAQADEENPGVRAPGPINSLI